MKLRDPEPHRVILATLDGDSLTAKHRESQLKDTSTIWRDVRTHQFVNTRDSAWSILDTILNIDPIKLQYIQDELMVCTTLRTRTRFALPNRTRFTLPTRTRFALMTRTRFAQKLNGSYFWALFKIRAQTPQS